MRNFKDFTRAIAGIASALKGINTIVDDIPVPSGGGIDYSTDEQDTGLKWIDGSPIYQKTISIPSLAFQTDIPHGISNYKQAVDAMIISTRDAEQKSYFILPQADTELFVKETSLYFGGSYANVAGKPAWVTLRYIKESE